jgi:N-acetylmuramoyl-L-alanine amidase
MMLIQQTGALVLMTRETDTDLAYINQMEAKTRKLVDLSRRANFVNNSSADLFILMIQACNFFNYNH